MPTLARLLLVFAALLLGPLIVMADELTALHGGDNLTPFAPPKVAPFGGRPVMKRLTYLFALALLTRWNTSPCLAQTSSGPLTLENLLNSDNAQKPAAVAQGGVAAAGPKRAALTVARPKDGVQHPDLDKAWADYDVAVAKVAESIKVALTEQFEAAASKGDLAAAEKWQNALKQFEKAGEFPTDSKTKAREKLDKAYEAVVRDLTMEHKIVEAKAARDESLVIKWDGPSDNTPEPVADVTVKVSLDRNIVAAGYSAHSDIYWVDKDQSKGVVELYFEDRQLASPRNLTSATLNIYVPNVTNAGTKDYVDVFCGQKRVGRFHGAVGGKWIEITLNVADLPVRTARWQLQLRPVGTDGVAIASKASGNGAQLRLKY
jgi:hypothetical protein